MNSDLTGNVIIIFLISADLFANSDIDSEIFLPDTPSNKSPQEAKKTLMNERAWKVMTNDFSLHHFTHIHNIVSEHVSSQQVRRSPRRLPNVNYGLNTVGPR